eukprot:SM000147S01102  [mRNA]  locus=s147:35995:37273:- [translate_table: standard]
MAAAACGSPLVISRAPRGSQEAAIRHGSVLRPMRQTRQAPRQIPARGLSTARRPGRRPPAGCTAVRPVRVAAADASGGASLIELIEQKNAAYPVIVYSKTWCPYCGMVKGLFKQLGLDIKAVELDELVEEQELQDALQELTGQGTVPNVFIGGKHIGGCDDTMALHRSGALQGLLDEAGAKKLSGGGA